MGEEPCGRIFPAKAIKEELKIGQGMVTKWPNKEFKKDQETGKEAIQTRKVFNRQNFMELQLWLKKNN